MRRALHLAARGLGRVEPNPLVGAVLVKGGRIIGEGFHRRFGGPHAEIEALRRCVRSPRAATCYVTLEPCCHFGKTPPCTDALIAAGVRRVVAAVQDPFSRVSGGGLRRLRAASIQVDVGLLRREAVARNAPFFKLHRTGRPWVILKWAQSLDGKIATRGGDSQWISSFASRRRAHALRGRVDAILVGINTVLRDDPQLTCRLVRPLRRATRIVLDTHLRIPLGSRLVRSARRTPTLVVTASAASRKVRALRAAGCEVLVLPTAGGRPRLDRLLDVLGGRNVTNLLVEGGGRVLGRFVDEGLADEAFIFVAPRLIGGREAPGPLDGLGPALMRALMPIRQLERVPTGVDVCHRLLLG